MTELLSLRVTLAEDDADQLRIEISTGATVGETCLALAAAIREIWREFAKDDPESADLFQKVMTGTLANPSLWTREEGSSHG